MTRWKEKIGIENSAFDRMREDFDRMLQATIGNMLKRQTDSASITIKLNIVLDSEEYGEEFDRHTRTVPKFDHKITSVFQTKSEVSGKHTDRCELVYDDIGDVFYLCKIPPIEGQLPFKMEEE